MTAVSAACLPAHATSALRHSLPASCLPFAEGIEAFHPNSVEFIARRIANNSGDVRRCLELCRR